MDNNSNQKDNKSTSRFIRWQQLTISEMSKVISVLQGIAFATIGFIVHQFVNSNFEFKNYLDKSLLVLGVLILFVYTIIFIILSINRLKDFRITTQIVGMESDGSPTNDKNVLREETKKLGERTWCLFYLSMWLFLIAEILIILGFAINIGDKF